MDGIHFSLLEFFFQAGPVGKAVVILLLVSSIWCWVIIIEGIVGAWRFGSAVRSWRRREPTKLFAPLLEAGQEAATRIIPGEGIGEARQRIVEAMNRQARTLIVSLEGGLANLAVISSVAPFVGLFGTVWGIMTSFTAIAASKDTSLAVVAPGIAEALATTAVGLAAAIPASIGYTRLGSAFSTRAQELAGLIEERAVDFVAEPRLKLPAHGIQSKEAA
jgi:biopolymer transport protein ExbB/TolQ